MPQFAVHVSHNGMAAGEVVEIDEHELQWYQGDIEAGFLSPVESSRTHPWSELGTADWSQERLANVEAEKAGVLAEHEALEPDAE